LTGAAARLPAGALPFSEALASQAVKNNLVEQDRLSRLADAQQKKQRGVGRWAAWLAFAATVVSGLLLFLQLTSDTWGGKALNAIHFFCLAAALAAAIYLRFAKPSAEWADARAKSEAARLAHFDLVRDLHHRYGVPDPSSQIRGIYALECTRAYLIEDQRNWHLSKIEEKKWPARGIAMLRVLAAFALGAAMLPAACEAALSLASPLLPPWLAEAARWISAYMGATGAALAGVFGGALQTLATNLASVSLHERNRRAYARVVDLLTRYLGEPLAKARVDAANGDVRAVDRYLWAVRADLQAETHAWNEALGLTSALMLDELQRGDRRI
jgi:hypothetical protein